MPTDPEGPPNIPRRRWPLRYVLLFVACWLALPIIVWLVWRWIESVRLDRTLYALEARKERLDVAEFDTKPATPAQQEASHLYAQAAKLVADRVIATQQAVRVSQLIQELCTTPPGAPANTTISQELQAFEEPYGKAFELIDRASPLKGVGWADGDRPQRQSIEEVRPITLTRANVARIARRACTGDTEGAAAALLASLRLQRFLNFKVVATRTAHSLQLVLTGGAPSSEILRQIQDEYASTTSDRTFDDLMLRERATWLSYILPGEFSDPPPGYGPRRITPVEAVVTRLARPLRNHRIVTELGEFAQAIEVARQPWPKTFDAVNAFAKAHPSIRSQSTPPGLLETLTRPWGAHLAAKLLTSYVNGIAETLARARVSAVAVAVARYSRDHGGALPVKLQELVPAYLVAPLIDPYNGAELHYRHSQTGYKVYSVGSNREDDVGEWEQHSDLQQTRRGNPLDIGIAARPWPGMGPLGPDEGDGIGTGARQQGRADRH
jgi:hypothetical protein